MLSYLTESVTNSELSRVWWDERLGVEFDLRTCKTQQIFNSYWTRVNKISRFVSCKQIKYLPQAEVNKWSERHWQIAILFNNRFSQFSYLNCSLTAQGSDLPFFMRGFHYAWAEYYLLQNTFRVITYEQTIICRKLFAGHVVGSRPMKMKRKMHRMIIAFIVILRWRLVIKQK